MNKAFLSLLMFLLTVNILHAHNQTETLSYLTDIFTTDDGLSSTKITCITQDSKGFTWIGTEDGLNRFDGYRFKVYRHHGNDSLSLINDRITYLYNDTYGTLWVATLGGLQYYDKDQDGFISVSLNQPDYIIKKNQCNVIFEDKRGDLWFSSSGLGVLHYSPQTKKSRLISPTHTRPENSLCSDYIRSIAEDKDGNLWFGSQNNGLSIYNPETDTCNNYNMANSNLSSNAIFGLNLMNNGNILIATVGGGIIFYDKEKQDFISYHSTFNTIASRSTLCAIECINGQILSGSEGNGILIFNKENLTIYPHLVFTEYLQTIGNSKVHCLYEDKNGYLWVGMHYQGLCVIKPKHTGFKTYRQISNVVNSLSYNHITGITTDKQKNIWIATDGGGINSYNPFTGIYTHYKYNPKQKKSITDNAVVGIFCDSKNRIWAGTYTEGLFLFNSKDHSFTQFSTNNTNNGLRSNFVKSIIEDNDGYIWLGTNGGGITKLDPEKQTFQTYLTSHYAGLASDYITILYNDTKNRLWIGTYSGLSCFDPIKGQFVIYGINEGLSDYTIYSIIEDENGVLWVGTQNGLNKYNPENNRFEHEFPEVTKYSSVINGIVPYKEHVWLSTNNGILCYNPINGEVRRFGQQHGLQSNEFIFSSYYKSPENEIYFGGINGLNAFKPEEVEKEDYIPKTYITGLNIMNQPVAINEKIKGRTILNKPIIESDKLTFHHSHKIFTLEVTAPDAFQPKTLYYACLLEGFNDEWVIYDHTRRYITYTNLNPGIYEFKVKASNNPDYWGDEYTSIFIEIEPPLWAIWWMRLIYICLMCLVMYIILRFWFVRIKEKNELRIEKLKLKQQEELSRIKTDFYTNISHEFRTPLTLIIGPLEYLLACEEDEEKKETGKLMLRNAKKLLRLINQLLEINKIEEGRMQLSVHEIELNLFIPNLLNPFKDLAKQKGIYLSYISDLSEVKIWYDPDLLEKCLTNLISNAFKFTAQEGKIEIRIQQAKDSGIDILVKDTGIGMDEETRHQVFERFFQRNKKLPGSGIGMHLAKNIVELHKGSLSVDSKVGKGTAFCIHVLPGNSHFNHEDIVEEPFIYINENEIIQVTIDNYSESINPENTFPGKKEALETQPTILLIEDDADMLRYIRNSLRHQYQIIEAHNGKTGLEKAQKLMPDLIITDVMMPEMSGLDLCRHLKNDPETSHIPIIILTAQSEIEHRLEGLETGADSYIPKPFNPKHLKIRVEKLIQLRQTMKERFSKSLKLEAEEMTLTGTDERLLQRAIDYVRANIENADMSVEAMSKDLGLSRTHLHRKLKALTGQSPVEFIKTIRMKQAAYLLGTGKLSISEVGYKVGYNTPSYFSSSFNAHFGMSPTTYMEQATKSKSEIEKE